MQFASRRGTPSKLNKIKLFINVTSTFCFRGKRYWDTESVVKVSILDVQVPISVGSYNALWVHS